LPLSKLGYDRGGLPQGLCGEQVGSRSSMAVVILFS
jgi:hypothetical protein